MINGTEPIPAEWEPERRERLKYLVSAKTPALERAWAAIENDVLLMDILMGALTPMAVTWLITTALDAQPHDAGRQS